MTNQTATQIQHQGIIKQMNDTTIFVSIVSASSCVSCQVKGACSASDMEEKIVPVKRIRNREYKIGEVVTVSINQSVGVWAVLLGYIFPLIVVVASLVVLTSIMEDQGNAGLISLGLLIPYYTILYLSRKIVDNNFEFKLGS